MTVKLDVSGSNIFQHNTLLQDASYNISHRLDHYKDERRYGIIGCRVGLGSFSLLIFIFIYSTLYIFAIFPATLLLLCLYILWDLRSKEKQSKKLRSNISYNNKIEDLGYLYDEILEEYNLQPRLSFSRVIDGS